MLMIHRRATSCLKPTALLTTLHVSPLSSFSKRHWHCSCCSAGCTVAVAQDDKDGAGGMTIDKTKYQEREKAFFTELNMTGEDLGTTLPAR